MLATKQRGCEILLFLEFFLIINIRLFFWPYLLDKQNHGEEAYTLLYYILVQNGKGKVS